MYKTATTISIRSNEAATAAITYGQMASARGPVSFVSSGKGRAGVKSGADVESGWLKGVDVGEGAAVCCGKLALVSLEEVSVQVKGIGMVLSSESSAHLS